MKEPLGIITDIKNFISSTNPFRFPYLEESVLNLLNELESTLYPVEEVVVKETPVVEEVVTEEAPATEEVVVEEEITIEDIQIEEPVTETTPKRNVKKK
jgi:hypothetical protein